MTAFKDINNVEYQSKDISTKMAETSLNGLNASDILMAYRVDTSQKGSLSLTNILNRANQLGEQNASTISDFDAEVSNNTDVSENTTARHTHANKALLDTYTQTEVNLADAVLKKHEHANKAILDGTEQSFTTALKANYDTAYTHSQATGNPHGTGISDISGLQRALDVAKSFNVLQPAFVVSPTATIPTITSPESDGGSFVAGLNILQYLDPINEIQNKNTAITFKDNADANLGTWLKTESPITDNRIIFPSNQYTFDITDASEPVNYVISVTLKLATPNNTRQKPTIRLRRAIANISGLFLFGTSVNSFYSQQAETDGTLVIKAQIHTFVKGEDDPFVTGGVIIDLSLKEGNAELQEITTVRIFRK